MPASVSKGEADDAKTANFAKILDNAAEMSASRSQSGLNKQVRPSKYVASEEITLMFQLCNSGFVNTVDSLDHRVDRVLSFFSCRWNWDSPTPCPQASFIPPFSCGERGTLTR